MLCSPIQRQTLLICNPIRHFAAKAAPAAPEWEEPKSISELRATGMANLALTKENGLDYQKIFDQIETGTFKSFEEEINEQFDLQTTEAATRESKRAGLMGYKVGMTHFWDKWGVLVPCTVIQVDRCQVTQVKTEAKEGYNAIQVGVGEKLPQKMLKP